MLNQLNSWVYSAEVKVPGSRDLFQRAWVQLDEPLKVALRRLFRDQFVTKDSLHWSMLMEFEPASLRLLEELMGHLEDTAAWATDNNIVQWDDLAEEAGEFRALVHYCRVELNLKDVREGLAADLARLSGATVSASVVTALVELANSDPGFSRVLSKLVEREGGWAHEE